jgi:hypothetical protein
MNTTITTHQYSIGEIFSEGWRIYRSQFIKIVIIILCVYIPVYSIRAFVTVTFLQEALGVQDATTLYRLTNQLTNSLLIILATIAIGYLVERTIQVKETTWSDAFKFAFSRWSSVILTGIIAGIILTGLYILLIIPGLIWSLYYTFWQYVVSLRNLEGKEALDYSKNLVRGQWWRVFGMLLLLVLVQVLVVLLISAGEGYIIKLINPLWLTNPFIKIISYPILMVVSWLFNVMQIVWFLNVDYLKNPTPEVQPVVLPEIMRIV